MNLQDRSTPRGEYLFTYPHASTRFNHTNTLRARVHVQLLITSLESDRRLESVQNLLSKVAKKNDYLVAFSSNKYPSVYSRYMR